MSASSSARISSGLTSGAVEEIGTVKSSSAAGASDVPGSRSMNMSLSPVLGRSSAVASVRIMLSYSGSMTISTTALPSSSSTAPMSPIRTPATRTVWPWPGVTACAVANSALIRSGASSHGKRIRCWSRM